MILIESWIEGTFPMLQHRMADGALEGGKTRANAAEAAIDPRNEAERCVYRLVSKQLAVPGGAFSRLLREAGGSHVHLEVHHFRFAVVQVNAAELIQIGIGDFRPDKGGSFGTFGLVAWDVLQPAIPTKTPARTRNGSLPETRESVARQG